MAETTENGNAQGGEGANTSTSNTSDATAQNTGANQTGAATQTATTEAQKVDITQTPEFKAALTSAVEKKIPQLKRQIAQSLTGEKEGGVTVEDLQRQLSETTKRAQAIEARESVRDYIADPVHKLNVKSENIAAIVKLVVPELEYDDDGKPTNLKEAVNSARTIASALFTNTPGHINANEGRNQVPTVGMNGLIRRGAGLG